MTIIKKLRIHTELKKSLKTRKINIKYEGDYRKLLHGFLYPILSAVHYYEVMNLPKAIQKLVDEIRKDTELQKINYLLSGFFSEFKDYTKWEKLIALQKKILKEYSALARVKTFSSFELKAVKLNQKYQKLVDKQEKKRFGWQAKIKKSKK